MKTFIHKIIIAVFFIVAITGCDKDEVINENEISTNTISGTVKLPDGSGIDVNNLQIVSPVGSSIISNGAYEMNTVKDKFLTQLVTNSSGEVLLMGFNYPGQINFEINAGSTALALLMNMPIALIMTPEAKKELIAKILNDVNFNNIVSSIEKELLDATSPLDVSNTQMAESIELYYRQLLFPQANKPSKAKKLDYSFEPVDIRVTNNVITFVNLGKTYESVVGIYKNNVKVESINIERLTFIPTTIGDAIGAFTSAYGGTELSSSLQPVEYSYTFESDGQYDIKIRTSKLADDAIENDIALLNNITNWGVDLILEVLPLGDCVQPVIANFKQHVQTFGSFQEATTEQEKLGLLYDVLYTFFTDTKTLISCLGIAEEFDDYIKKFSSVFKFLDLVGKIGNGGNILLGITQLVADEGKMDLCYNMEGTVASECEANGVYVAGYEVIGNNEWIARVWKDGVVTSLSDGGNFASSVFVSGNDAYVSGSVLDQTNTVGVTTVWKNGNATLLSDGSNSAGGSSVYVSGNDFYVSGSEIKENNKYVATISKNGVTSLLTDGSNNAYATSVYVAGSDVYVSGSESNINNINIAKIWKNGVETSLTDGSKNASAEWVNVSGGDIYVAGYEYLNVNTSAVAKIWKNGVATSLTDGNNQAFAHSVFVYGTDVYAAGLEFNGTVSVAKIWKNGVPTSLTDGSFYAVARSVYVVGDDVYVAGHEAEGTNHLVAKVWKNGIATSLTADNGYARAFSIFVKE